MKLFPRGLLALGLTAALALTAAADTPVAAPVANAAAAGCGCAADAGPANRLLKGKFGKAGRRTAGDRFGDAYFGFNQKVNGFFQRLAGPPVDVAAAGGPGGKKDRGPLTQPGTVVFPQHPFARSPRDFFMTEEP